MRVERIDLRRRAREFAKAVRAERRHLRRYPRNSRRAARPSAPRGYPTWMEWVALALKARPPGRGAQPEKLRSLKLLRISTIAALACLAVGGATIALLPLIGRAILASAPSPLPGHTFWSTDGRLLGSRGYVVGAPVHLDGLPVYVVQAVVAVEDRRFQTRVLPIDLRGIVRAAIANSKCGCVAEGGSTLAQQLAKLRLRDTSPRLDRKVREALVAAYLQQQLGKSGILESYLNSVYWGHGFVGLRAAAKGYFGKEPQDLTLGEAAELAGMVNAPSELNPMVHRQASWSRARVVLGRMVREGYIAPDEAQSARQPDVVVQTSAASRGFLLDALNRELARRGRSESTGAYATTIDARLQEAAERAVASYYTTADEEGAHEVAVVVMRPDGGIAAMVGGRDYAKSQFNRALDAKRPIGSLAKLLIYGAALDSGIGADDIINDAPVRIGQWAPRNFDGRFMGPIPVRQALADSRNAAAVRLAQRIGLSRVIDLANAAGVKGKLDPAQPSFLLGAFSMSPVEVASMFAALTHCGRVSPHMIEGAGPAPLACDPILSPKAQEGLISSLQDTLARGTGRAAEFPGSDGCFAKTGTTNDARDSWFAGDCGDLIGVVWVGNDDNSRTRTTGGGLPARIWRDVMSASTTDTSGQGRLNEARP